MNDIPPFSPPPGTPSYAPFETLRYDPSWRDPAGAHNGFVRLDRHLARLERSSAWLGLGVDREAVVATLQRAVSGLAGAHRVRLELEPGGRLELSVTPLDRARFDDTPAAALASARAVLAAGGSLPRAALALQRIDENDPARAHKTTARELYYAARHEADRLDLEDVLFLDSRGSLAEGSIASVFLVTDEGAGQDGDPLVFTPPLSSGALPGVLREELVEQGLVAVRELELADLRAARAVLLGSSVRGLRQIELSDTVVSVA